MTLSEVSQKWPEEEGAKLLKTVKFRFFSNRRIELTGSRAHRTGFYFCSKCSVVEFNLAHPTYAIVTFSTTWL